MADAKQRRPAQYLEAARTRLALIHAALIGCGYEPDATALSATITAVRDLQRLVEEGLQRAQMQDAALQNLARDLPDEQSRATLALTALPAGSDAVN